MNFRPNCERLNANVFKIEYRKYLHDLGVERGFLNKAQKLPTIKGYVNKFDNIKIKFFCSSRNTIKEFKRQAPEWEKR
jgi:hypothetical protein